jgi:hypothetical protein
MKALLCALPLTIGLAGMAAAQSFTHNGSTFTLGYDDWKVGVIFSPGTAVNGNTKVARARTDWGFGNNLGLQFNLDYADFEIEDAFTSSSTTYALHPYYEFSADTRVGLFYQTTNFEFYDESIDYYGIEAMYSPMPELSVEAYLGSGRFGLGDDVDITTYGMTFHYAAGEKLGLKVAYDHETLNDGGSRLNLSRFNIGLDYHIDTGGSMPPIILSAEAGTVDLLYFNLDLVGAKLTIPLGGTKGVTGRKLFRERALYWAVGSVSIPF